MDAWTYLEVVQTKNFDKLIVARVVGFIMEAISAGVTTNDDHLTRSVRSCMAGHRANVVFLRI